MSTYFSERKLASLCVSIVCILLFIWVIPETIALRHGLLVVGFFVSCVLIRNNLTFIYPLRISNLSLYILFSIFLWVGIHYTFFSLNKDLELSEIKSLWVRAFLGCVLAVGFAVSLRKYSTLAKYFYIAIFSTPLVNLGSYIYASILNNGFVNPNSFVRFLFTKIETAYFGGVAAAVTVANAIFFLDSVEKNKFKKIAFCMLGIFLIFISAIVSNTKNGMLIVLMLSSVMGTIFLFSIARFELKKRLISFGVLSLLLILVFSVWGIHKRYATAGWENIFYDVKVAINIDQNTQWNQVEGAPQYPLNALGVPVAVNTYSRVAWATVGLRLITQYPLGYGSINRSFDGMQDIAGIAHGHKGQTHSGWVDYGLAFGVPGLIILISAIFLTMYCGLRNLDRLNLVAVMICGMLAVFSIFAETTWKQYFEATLFFIAFSCTLIACRGYQH
jgi:hypothetical protein